jgi:hypothetical protein
MSPVTEIPRVVSTEAAIVGARKNSVCERAPRDKSKMKYEQNNHLKRRQSSNHLTPP